VKYQLVFLKILYDKSSYYIIWKVVDVTNVDALILNVTALNPKHACVENVVTVMPKVNNFSDSLDYQAGLRLFIL